MQIDIVELAKVIESVAVVGGILFAVFKFLTRAQKQEREIAELKSELCMHTYVLLAVLDGLKQQGCNGPVTEARDRLQKHVNKMAHDQEEKR